MFAKSNPFQSTVYWNNLNLSPKARGLGASTLEKLVVRSFKQVLDVVLTSQLLVVVERPLVHICLRLEAEQGLLCRDVQVPCQR